MTNAEAIKILSALPPDAVAPMNYIIAAGQPLNIVLGRISVRMRQHGGAFYVGDDAEIIVDGRPLDVGCGVQTATIRFAAGEPVCLDLRLVPFLDVPANRDDEFPAPGARHLHAVPNP